MEDKMGFLLVREGVRGWEGKRGVFLVLPQNDLGVGLNNGEAPSGPKLRGVARKTDVFRGGVLGTGGVSDTGEEGKRGVDIDTLDAKTGKESERALCRRGMVASLAGTCAMVLEMYPSSEDRSVGALAPCCQHPGFCDRRSARFSFFSCSKSAIRSSASFESLGRVAVLVRAHSGTIKFLTGFTGACAECGMMKGDWVSDPERHIGLEGDDLGRKSKELVVISDDAGSKSERMVR
jgi:hypothetical protein